MQDMARGEEASAQRVAALSEQERGGMAATSYDPQTDVIRTLFANVCRYRSSALRARRSRQAMQAIEKFLQS